jgi:hypothetical protein
MVMGLLENPQDATQNLGFTPIQADALRFKLWGYRQPPEIAEMELLGQPAPNRR